MKYDGFVKTLHLLRCCKNKIFQRTLVRRNNLIFARLEYEVFYKSILVLSFYEFIKYEKKYE